MTDLFKHSGALFSDDRLYRKLLWRERGEGSGTLLSISLNPSIANESTDDPTITRVCRRAWGMGLRRVEQANIFSLVSTDPRSLLTHPFPIGDGNDEMILDRAKNARMVLCGWGIHGAIMGRGTFVARMLRNEGITLHVLGLTKDGHPRHPLYISYDVTPVEWRQFPEVR